MTNPPPIFRPDLRGRCTQDDILLAFADRLREHPKLNDQNVVISDQPIPTQFPGGGFCVTVSAGDGRFPENMWIGGHHATATEEGSVIIGVYLQIARDRPGRRESSIVGRRHLGNDSTAKPERPSLIPWKRTILKILTVKDWTLTTGAHSQTWEPTKRVLNTELNIEIPLLREIPRPMHVIGPMDVPSHDSWIGLQISFSVVWDWDLYA
jgi:hypothetical protein